jgi:hypothetical protein
MDSAVAAFRPEHVRVLGILSWKLGHEAYRSLVLSDNTNILSTVGREWSVFSRIGG